MEIVQLLKGDRGGCYQATELVSAVYFHLQRELSRCYWNIEQEDFEDADTVIWPDVQWRRYFWGDCECGCQEKGSAWSRSHSHSAVCYQAVTKREIAKWKAFNPDHDYDEARDAERSIRQAACAEAGIPWNDGWGAAVHCTCTYEREWLDWIAQNGHGPDCRIGLPNFKFEDVEINWYKHPGRGMTVNVQKSATEWEQWMGRCLASIRAYESENSAMAVADGAETVAAQGPI